jgi:membrane-bound serine protease (ClpP class)
LSLALAIALFGLGLALIVAEVLFPSLGLLSVLAGICLVAAVGAAFAIDADTGVTFLMVAAITVPAALLLGLKLFPKSPLGKHMVVDARLYETRAATDERDLALRGRRGDVEATLRPAGLARIDGRRVDVVSRGESIDVGTRVHVVAVEGNRVVVARDEDERPATTEPLQPEGS